MSIRPMLALPLKGEPNPRWVYEPKLDGVRVLVHKQGAQCAIYTRTMHDQRTKLSHLETAIAAVPFDFIIDGEIVAVDEVVTIQGQEVPVSSFHRVESVLGSGSSRATMLQRSRRLSLVVFDCLSAQGNDVTGQSDSIRRNIAELIVDQLGDDVMLIPRWKGVNPMQLFADVVAHGGEGLMVKNPLMPYKQGQSPANTWYKLKATDTADVVITGYTEGKGKYAGQIGAVEFGQYKGNKLVARSSCSGMDDAMRARLSKDRASFVGKVMEIKYFGRCGPGKNFRNPVFVRIRDDKTPKECVWD